MNGGIRMKKTYKKPEMEITEFNTEDVIITSKEAGEEIGGTEGD